MPDPVNCSDAEWADYVFNTDNLAGVVRREWWMRHAVQLLVPRRAPHRHRRDPAHLRPRELFNTRVDFNTAKEIAG